MTPHHASLGEWQAYVLRSRTAHLYRIASDGNGGWTVTRPGTRERLHFPAHDHFTSSLKVEVNDAESMQDAPPRDAHAAMAAPMTPAEKHAAEVRSSYVNLSA